MTSKLELERKISDWQGRTLHAYTEKVKAHSEGRVADVAKWETKWQTARACLEALYEELYPPR